MMGESRGGSLRIRPVAARRFSFANVGSRPAAMSGSIAVQSAASMPNNATLSPPFIVGFGDAQLMVVATATTIRQRTTPQRPRRVRVIEEGSWTSPFSCGAPAAPGLSKPPACVGANGCGLARVAECGPQPRDLAVGIGRRHNPEHVGEHLYGFISATGDVVERRQRAPRPRVQREGAQFFEQGSFGFVISLALHQRIGGVVVKIGERTRLDAL